MKPHILAIALLAPVGVLAQDSARVAALPDSSYLILTLELPVHGTFQATRVEYLRNGSRERTVVHQIRNVEVEACVLSWRYRSRTHEVVRSASSDLREIRVPLKAIDLETIDVRMATAARAHYDPPAYEIVGYAKDRRARPIGTRNIDNGFTTREWAFAIPVSDEQVARRLAAVLVDAAQRCDVWRTAPLPVIR